MIQSEQEARAYVATRASASDLDRVELFVARLAQANQTQNLVASASLASVWQRHVADSVQLLDHVPRETGRWLDLGSGAGFPGLVLAMLKPKREFVLIESRGLRIAWLKVIIEDLAVSNCTVIGAPLDRVQAFEAEVISARAFAPLNRLVASAGRFSTSATRWVLPKGRTASHELESLPPSLRQMFHVEQSVTDKDAGIVVGTGRVETAT